MLSRLGSLLRSCCNLHSLDLSRSTSVTDALVAQVSRPRCIALPAACAAKNSRLCLFVRQLLPHCARLLWLDLSRLNLVRPRIASTTLCHLRLCKYARLRPAASSPDFFRVAAALDSLDECLPRLQLRGAERAGHRLCRPPHARFAWLGVGTRAERALKRAEVPRARWLPLAFGVGALMFCARNA